MDVNLNLNKYEPHTVPSIVPSLVEARVLSSRAAKLHWTIAYSPEHELIEGFFVGYRSFERPSQATPSLGSGGNLASVLPTDQAGISSNNKNPSPQSTSTTTSTTQGKMTTYTYKTIRLFPDPSQQQTTMSTDNSKSDQQQNANTLNNLNQHAMNDPRSGSDILLAPTSTMTKTMPGPRLATAFGGHLSSAQLMSSASAIPSSSSSSTAMENGASQQQQQAHVMLIQSYELIISGLERDTEYTIMIQCFNQKGAGPTSDPIMFRTFANGMFQIIDREFDITLSSFEVKINQS